jgi:hypothetical protein
MVVSETGASWPVRFAIYSNRSRAMAGTPAAQPRTFRCGPFELDVRAGELRKHGIRIKLRD